MQETVVLLCSLIISATIGGMTGWFLTDTNDIQYSVTLSEDVSKHNAFLV